MPACVKCGNQISEKSIYPNCMRCGHPIGAPVPAAEAAAVPAERSHTVRNAVLIIVGLLVAYAVVPKGTQTAVAPDATQAVAQAATTAAAAAPQTTPAKPTGTPQAKVGDTVREGNWAVTVTKVETVKTLTWSEFGNKTDALGNWLVLSLTLRNVGDRNFPINQHDFELLTNSAVKYDPSTKFEVISFISYAKLTHLGEQFPPGVDVKTALVFDIAPDSKGLRLALKQTKGTTIALDK